jgi:hypothetical protein
LLQTLRITSEQSVFARLFGRESFAGSSTAVEEDALECTTSEIHDRTDKMTSTKHPIKHLQAHNYKLITCSCSSTTCIIVSLNTVLNYTSVTHLIILQVSSCSVQAFFFLSKEEETKMAYKTTAVHSN